MKIAVTGLIGYERAVRLYLSDTRRVKERLPEFYIKRFLSLKNTCAGNPDIEKTPACVYIKPIGEGGVLRALWQLGEDLSCGVKADALRIPVCQEVIEISEIFSEDPYQAPSKGAFVLALSDDYYPEDTVAPGSVTVIGRSVKDNVKVLTAGERERFLTPPKRQEKDLKSAGRR